MVEAGAKAAIFPHDASTAAYLARPRRRARHAGDGRRRRALRARDRRSTSPPLTPRVALPHAPDNVVPLEDAAGVPVHMVFIGTCTGGRVVDFHDALDAFERAGGRLAPGVQLVLTPASREVHDRLLADGTLRRLRRRRAPIVTTPAAAPAAARAA